MYHPMIRTVVQFVESKTCGGTEQALLQLFSGLDRTRWRPILFYRPEPGIAPLLESARALEIKTRAIPWMGGPRFPLQLLQFARAIQVVKPAVFHAHLHWPTACNGGLLASVLARVPAVVVTMQLFPEFPWTRAVLGQQKLIDKGIHRYIAVSKGVAREMQRAFQIPGDKITLVHNAVNASLFSRPANMGLRAELSGGSGHPIILTVARLDWQKGLPYLLEAAAGVQEATFVLAGDGADRPMLEARASTLGIADRVRFLGRRDDVPDLLAACDLFVLPSLHEGLPLSVLEAMAAGKPVIATAIPGTDEAVIQDKTGILVPPADPVALAEAIRSLLCQPQMARRFGMAGKVRVQEEFSNEVMVGRVMRVYDELTDPREVRHARA